MRDDLILRLVMRFFSVELVKKICRVLLYLGMAGLLALSVKQIIFAIMKWCGFGWPSYWELAVAIAEAISEAPSLHLFWRVMAGSFAIALLGVVLYGARLRRKFQEKITHWRQLLEGDVQSDETEWSWKAILIEGGLQTLEAMRTKLMFVVIFEVLYIMISKG